MKFIFQTINTQTKDKETFFVIIKNEETQNTQRCYLKDTNSVKTFPTKNLILNHSQGFNLCNSTQ